MATHSSTFAWKIPWMEEPGRLQSMGMWRVGHNWATSLSLFTFIHRRRKWQPTGWCFKKFHSHKLSSLKQCKFFLQLWSPKIHSQSHWAKVKISRTGSLCALREIPFSCLFQVVEPTFLCSWSSSIQQLYHSILYVHYYVSLFVITFHL